jgi:hypothetical protein
VFEKSLPVYSHSTGQVTLTGQVAEGEMGALVFWNGVVLLLKGATATKTATVGPCSAWLTGQGELVGQAIVI